MKKIALFATLSLTVLSSTKQCTLYNYEKNEADYVQMHNPSEILRQSSINKEHIDYKGRTYIYYKGTESDMPFLSFLNDHIESFEHVEENGTQTDNHINYYVSMPGFLVSIQRYMTFYEDGYVAVKRFNSKAQESEYYYRFDQSAATQLFEKAEYVYQEDLRIEKEEKDERERCQKIIDDADFSYVLSEIEEANPFELEFWYFHKPYKESYYCNLTDDGTIKETLRNAEYISVTHSTYNSPGGYYINIDGESKEEGSLQWWLYFYESTEEICVSFVIYDKFNNRYNKTLYYSVDRTSTQIIFNKAIEMRNEYIDSKEQEINGQA